MKLDAYIVKLLENHDCVIVPDFGGFIGNYEPAQIDQLRGLIYPPSKRLLFNQNLTSNDGLLGNAIVQGENLPYSEAIELIRQKISDWEKTLNDGGRIHIEELGFLFKQNDKVIFEQSREVNLLLSAYGLTPIKLTVQEEKQPQKVEVKTETIRKVEIHPIKPTVQPEIAEEKKVEVKVDKKITEETKVIEIAGPVEEVEEEKKAAEGVVVEMPKRKRKPLRYMVAAALIPLAFYSYWIPMETDFLDTGSIQMSDFNPLKKSFERQYAVRDKVDMTAQKIEWKDWEELTASISNQTEIYSYHFDDELYIPIRLDQETVESTDVLTAAESTDVAEAQVTTETVEVSTTTASKGDYHVIAGCFSVKANAENLVKDLMQKGYNASIIDQNGGLWRVSAGGHDKRSGAIDAQSQLQGDGISTWVLKK